MDEKYFLYARKSTDTEDKQVLSIEAQVVELRKFAVDNNLHIVDTIVEKKSAKKGADNANDQIPDEAKAATFDKNTGKPASHETDDKKPENAHVPPKTGLDSARTA